MEHQLLCTCAGGFPFSLLFHHMLLWRKSPSCRNCWSNINGRIAVTRGRAELQVSNSTSKNPAHFSLNPTYATKYINHQEVISFTQPAVATNRVTSAPKYPISECNKSTESLPTSVHFQNNGNRSISQPQMKVTRQQASLSSSERFVSPGIKHNTNTGIKVPHKGLNSEVGSKDRKIPCK